MGIERQLSQLELTALGIVMKRGQCVAHAVVSEFAESQTFAYRSGAGSIYPLLKRLAAAGLLSCADRKYRITEAGIEALREWIKPPFAPDCFSTDLDEFRSRAYFLKLLDADERAEFVRLAIEGLTVLLGHCRETLEAQRASGDRFGELAMLGAVRETEARIAWMFEVGSGLGIEGPVSPDHCMIGERG